MCCVNSFGLSLGASGAPLITDGSTARGPACKSLGLHLVQADSAIH